MVEGVAKSCGALTPQERVLLVVALALGACWRLVDVGPALLFGDEYHSLRDISLGYGHLLSYFSPAGSGMALPLLQRAVSDVVGVNHWSLRAPAYMGGLALLVSVYFLGRALVGRSGALVALVLAACSSPLIYYAHFARSYSATAFLCLLLVHGLQRLLDGSATEARAFLYPALVSALLPYFHPTATSFVLALFAATGLALWREGRGGADLWRLFAALAAGLGGALLLHLPALDSLASFVSDKTTTLYAGEFGFWDVVALLVGSRMLSMLLLPVLLLFLLRLGQRKGARSLPLVTACIAPGLAVAIVQPFGDAYAYARYALSAVPFACLVLGWGVADLVGQLRLAPRARSWALVASGALLGALLFLAGPYSLAGPAPGPHANTYLGLFELPAFDVPWDDTPVFYRQLADAEEPVVLLEAPALVSRMRHLYRNYYLQHGLDTELGFFGPELKDPPEGPYVSFSDSEWRAKTKADYLVLHFDVAAELGAYWDFVFESQRALAQAPSVVAYMKRHSDYSGVPIPDGAGLRIRLEQELGPLYYEDDRIAVWRLRE